VRLTTIRRLLKRREVHVSYATLHRLLSRSSALAGERRRSGRGLWSRGGGAAQYRPRRPAAARRFRPSLLPLIGTFLAGLPLLTLELTRLDQPCSRVGSGGPSSSSLGSGRASPAPPARSSAHIGQSPPLRCTPILRVPHLESAGSNPPGARHFGWARPERPQEGAAVWSPGVRP
jgi:hypothetical protein